MRTVHAAPFDSLDPRTAYRLWQLRIDVFVVEQECAYSELDGRDLEPGTVHLWIEEEGVPVATLRILEDRDAGASLARIGRVATAASARGRGLAGELIRAAIERIGDRESVLDAQSHLAQWYARFGYEPDGEEFLEDGIPHTPMRRRAAP